MATDFDVATGGVATPASGDRLFIVRQVLGAPTPFAVLYETTLAPSGPNSGASLLSARADHTHANYIAKVQSSTAGHVAVFASDGSVVDGGPTGMANGLDDIATVGGPVGTDLLIINRPSTAIDYRGALTALLAWILNNDGSVDPAQAPYISSPPNGSTVLGYQPNGTLSKFPYASGSSGGSAATTFSVGATPSNIAIGGSSTLTVTPGSGGWPSGEVVTAVATGVTGSFDAATRTGAGTTPVTFIFTASGSASSGSLSATAPNMTLSGSPASLTTTAASTYPAMTLSNSPAFDTSTPLQGAASLSAGSGVMASGIVPPSGTQGVTLECFIRTTAPGYSAQFLRLDDASGHWMAAIFNQGTDSGNSSLYHISPQTETYQGVPYSGTSPVSGQRCHVALQTTSNGKVAVWIDGVLNTGTGDSTALSMTDALKVTINVSSAGLTAIDSVRLSAGRRYTENQNFTPPTSMARDSSAMVIYTFDAQTGAGS